MTTPPIENAQTTRPSAAAQAGSGPSASAKPAHASSAIFVAHGMGQQIRYETLSQIAHGLSPREVNQDAQFKHISIKAGEDQLNGIQVKLDNDKVVDIFEGYWAPQTEGQITLRNVISFLFNAGINGCKNNIRPFKRFLFNKHYEFPRHRLILATLLLALLAVAALVIMNSAIAVVTAGSSISFFSKSKAISDEFIIQLTTVFDLFLAVTLIYVLALTVSNLLRDLKSNSVIRAIIRVITLLLFWVMLLATITAGILIACLSYKRIGSEAPPLVTSLVDKLLAPITFLGPDFNWRCGVVLISMATIFAAFGIVYFIYLLFRPFPPLSAVAPAKKKRSAVLLCLPLLAVLVYLMATQVMAPNLTPQKTASLNWVNLSPWLLLVAVSEMIRRLFVQYLGDVAIYVTPYSLDRFYNLREKIRDSVTKEAEIVFKAKTAQCKFVYDQVFVVGHSLGSVIVYDALNKLLCDDKMNGNSLDVANRTKLLLTFGSPLDKITFLFARPADEIYNARNVAQSASRPLISEAAARQFYWINIFSPFDIISGKLDFFDPPEPEPHTPATASMKPVYNLIDWQTTLYLAAHVEYWNNDLLFNVLRGAISSGQKELKDLIEVHLEMKKTKAYWLS